MAYEEHVVSSQLFPQPASDLLAIFCSVQTRKHTRLCQGNVLAALPCTFLRLLKTDTSTSRRLNVLKTALMTCGGFDFLCGAGNWHSVHSSFGLLEGSTCIFRIVLHPQESFSKETPTLLVQCFRAFTKELFNCLRLPVRSFWFNFRPDTVSLGFRVETRDRSCEARLLEFKLCC